MHLEEITVKVLVFPRVWNEVRSEFKGDHEYDKSVSTMTSHKFFCSKSNTVRILEEICLLARIDFPPYSDVLPTKKWGLVRMVGPSIVFYLWAILPNIFELRMSLHTFVIDFTPPPPVATPLLLKSD